MKIFFWSLSRFPFFEEESVHLMMIFLREGLIECLDVNEENNALICLQLNCLMFFDTLRCSINKNKPSASFLIHSVLW